MDKFLHILSVYLRRFWPEVLGFWLISVTASLWALSDSQDFPDVPLMILEALAWFAFTLRLMQAESTFLTLGGWKVRPLESRLMASARWSFYLFVIFPVLLLRTICLSISFRWTIQDWWFHGSLSWVLLCVTLVLGALAISATGKISRGGVWTKWIAVLLGAGFCWMILPLGILLGGHRMTQLRGGGGGSGAFETPRGLVAFVPANDQVIEMKQRSNWPEKRETGFRLICRFPIHAATPTHQDGLSFTVTDASPSGEQIALSFQIRGPSHLFRDWVGEGLITIRYSNGMWGWPDGSNGDWKAIMLAGFPATQYSEQAKLFSPKIYPWVTASWEELLKGAECYLLAPDASVKLPPPPVQPTAPMSIGFKEQTVKLPTLPDHPTMEQIKAAAVAAIDQFQIYSWSENSKMATLLLEIAGSAAVPFVLECAPFGERAWSEHVRPFLRKFSNAEHLPSLLKLLETDPRVADVLIAKGWKNEALPLLRTHLGNRLPLGYEGFRALAELKDASLAKALEAQVLNGPSNEFNSSWPPLLKDHPGIDWLALVKEGCRRSAMDDGEPNSYWLENSAPLGDRELFRKQVGSWLRNTDGPPSKRTIGAWIAQETWDGESAAFPAWVRENFEKLRWDDAVKRWVL